MEISLLVDEVRLGQADDADRVGHWRNAV